jgi:hypothetical protein
MVPYSFPDFQVVPREIFLKFKIFSQKIYKVTQVIKEILNCKKQFDINKAKRL